MSQPVESEVQERGLVYLDNAQTTRLDPTILDTMYEFMVNNYGVPGGGFGYRLEEEAREAIERAREAIARRINARPEETIFTSGGTESTVESDIF